MIPNLKYLFLLAHYHNYLNFYMLNFLISLKLLFLLLYHLLGRGGGGCLIYSFKNNETIESFCKSKNIIFINNYSSFLTANGAPKKRCYGDFLSFTKLGFSVLAKNIKWRRNSSSINSASNPSPVNSIKIAKLAPSTSKPTNNSLISKEFREPFMQLFTSFFLDSNVS